MSTADKIGCSIEFPPAEIRDIVAASILLGAMFWIAYGWDLSATILIGSMGLMMHELGHKLAGRWRCINDVRFVMSPFGIAAGFLTSFFVGHTLAAPGGVTVGDNANRRDQLIMAVAGPLTNVVLFIAFVLIYLYYDPWLISPVVGAEVNVWFAVALVNLYLAFFNMIPFPMFDGHHIWHSNKIVWATVFLSTGGIVLYFWMDGVVATTLMPLFQANGMTAYELTGIALFPGFIFVVRDVIGTNNWLVRSALQDEVEEIE